MGAGATHDERAGPPSHARQATGFGRRLDQPPIRSQAEVIVGSEIHQLPAGNRNDRALPANGCGQGAVQMGLLKKGQFVVDPGERVHEGGVLS